MAVTVFPIRVLLVAILLLLCWPCAFIAVWGRRDEDKLEPLTGWRSMPRYIISGLSRMIFFAGGFHYYNVKGQPATPREAPLLVLAPHTSYFDAIPICYLHLTSVVAKAEASEVFFFKTLIEVTQPVFVSRDDSNSRVSTIKEIRRRATSDGKWPQIAIFPEGTCTNRSCLISFKPGAFYPGVPVQPVLIRYQNRLDTVTWTWDGLDVYTIFFYTLCQFHTNVEIEFLPVYTPNEEEKSDAKLFANNVRQVMADKLGVPVTDHTYDDCKLMQIALENNLPLEVGLIEYSKINAKLGLNLDTIKEMMARYINIARRTDDGQIDVETFAKYLHLPVSDALTEVFELYDRDGSGMIDFREYLIGMSLVAQPSNTEDTIRTAFTLFDPENTGHISEERLTTIMRSAFNMAAEQTHKLFTRIDASGSGTVTYEEFYAYAQKNPEYAKLFHIYQELHTAKQRAVEVKEAEGRQEYGFGSDVYLGSSFDTQSENLTGRVKQAEAQPGGAAEQSGHMEVSASPKIKVS